MPSVKILLLIFMLALPQPCLWGSNQPRGNYESCSNCSRTELRRCSLVVFPALPPLDEITMERVMEELEHRCHENMTHAMETEEGLGIEYDEDVVCDVCQSPDGEDNNEMVFCDKCNICVHQVRAAVTEPAFF